MTLTHVKIDSDITGRFKRIIEQVEFDGKLTFVTEILQNCQRSGSTRVEITLEENKLIVKDNGVGCEDPKNLFTLDLSGFGYGFGEGFSSVYTLVGLVKVKTLNWEAEVDVAKIANKRIIKKEDLDVPIRESDFYQGFIVELESDKIKNNRYEIEDTIRTVTSTITDIEFILNGEPLSKYDIFKEPEGNVFHELFDNHMYKGRLCVDTMHSYKGIDVYYEDRFVQNIHLGLTGISGNILVKKNRINLKAPDRTSIIRDEKRDLLMTQLRRNIVTLLIFLLKEGTVEDIETYADVIRYHIPIEKSIRFLQINEGEIKNQFEVRKLAEETKAEKETNVEHDTETEEETYSSPSSSSENESSSSEENNDYNLTHLERNQEDTHFSSFVSSPAPERVSKDEMKYVSISNIKRKANVVWVQRNRMAEFEELIARYEYYGIFTFVSPNGLFDDALYYLGITHISEVERDAIEKQYEVKNIGAKNKKELRAMEVLQFIESCFKLPETFYISDIDCKMIVSLQEKRIYQEKLEVEGYAKADSIHLNRKSLQFGKMNAANLGKKQWGLHEISFVLSNIELISHELAHRIYSTEDNTKEHYEMIFKIQKQIGQFMLTSE